MNISTDVNKSNIEKKNLAMSSTRELTSIDMAHLRRTIELASEAVDAGDAPFGSVLVDSRNPSVVIREDRNRINSMNNATRHSEFNLARWASTHMTPEDRKLTIMYTSGEHCAMCAAAHGWVGLGRIVYVANWQLYIQWQAQISWEKGEEPQDPPVVQLSIQDVAPGVEVSGPVPELEDDIYALHRRFAGL
ncbi:cytidine/deoxycytidylate deaminase [Xylaria nigripes]|nr:cytidine/deoxycytidylate deaminase [Xylaria nigripes]